MAAGTAFLGYGSKLMKGAAGAGTIVGEILSFDGPGMETDSVETTHTESPNSHKEFIPGLIDAGEISCEIQYEAAGTGVGTLVTDFQARTVSTYHILFSNSAASTLEFSAFIKSLTPKMEVQDKVTASLTLKLSGKPTYTA